MDMHFEGVIFQTHARELARRLGRRWPPILVLDLRPAAAWEAGHVPGAMQVPLEAIESGLPAGAAPDVELVFVGSDASDPRVRRASTAARAHGARRCVELTGGMLEWASAGLPVDTGHRAAA